MRHVYHDLRLLHLYLIILGNVRQTSVSTIYGLTFKSLKLTTRTTLSLRAPSLTCPQTLPKELWKTCLVTFHTSLIDSFKPFFLSSRKVRSPGRTRPGSPILLDCEKFFAFFSTPRFS